MLTLPVMTASRPPGAFIGPCLQILCCKRARGIANGRGRSRRTEGCEQAQGKPPPPGTLLDRLDLSLITCLVSCDHRERKFIRVGPYSHTMGCLACAHLRVIRLPRQALIILRTFAKPAIERNDFSHAPDSPTKIGRFKSRLPARRNTNLWPFHIHHTTLGGERNRTRT